MRIAGILLLLVSPMAVAGNVEQESFDVVVPSAPQPVRSDGHEVLFYELHLTNFTAHPLVLRAVRVLSADGRQTLGEFNASALADRMVWAGADSTARKGETIVGAGQRAIVFIDLELSEHAVPGGLRHDIDYSAVGDDAAHTLHAGNVLVDKTSAVVLGPPLRTGFWVAVHSPVWPRGHRRVIYTLAGKARIPGRYAIDFVGVDELGRTTQGDRDLPPDAIGYGSPVLAGADAKVAAIRDGMMESPSIRGNSAHQLGEGAGNYVALQLAENKYVFYEHLKPGSVRVKVGECVHLGDVLGELGFSGDTVGPHLHVHVADSVDPLAGEGLPFVIESYKEAGRYSNIGDLGKQSWQALAAPSGRNEMQEWPAANAVLEFISTKDPRKRTRYSGCR